MVYAVLALLGLFVIYAGITMCQAGRWVGRYNPKYTIESMDAFAKPAGVVVVVLGVLELLCCFGLWGLFPKYIFWVLIAFLAADAIAYVVLMKKYLVKRVNPGAGNSDNKED